LSLAPDRRGRALWRFAPLVAIVLLIGLAYGVGLHRQVSFETLMRHRTAIDQFVAGHELSAVAAFFLLYVGVVGLSLPCGSILTVVAGILFGALIGTVVSAVGALVGATVLFLIARSAAGEFLTRRAGPVAAKLAEGFRADAFNYLLFLRLVPFPFWLINLAPALFGVRLGTYVAATAIGILPGTVAFAVFGAGLDSVMAAQQSRYDACIAAGHADCGIEFDLSHVLTPPMFAALVALGILALVPVLARRFLGRRIGAGVARRH
jgi:uncharacterized membrane protein YdjX (TVP38/TMEM64 family)